MKKRMFLIVVAAIMLLLVPTVGAQPTTYNTGFQVANQSSSTATIVVTYYNQDGSVDNTVNDTIPGDGSVTYFPIDASSGFNGSVVISSDQPVAAITNVLGDGGTFGASYESFSGGAATVNIPLIMKGNFGFDTWFNVQNTGTTAADVSVAYAGTACTDSATIQPGAAATFNQGTDSCLPAGHVGAATVSVTDTVNDSIVATVLQTGPAQLLAYNGFTSNGSTDPVMPLVQGNNFGFFTGIQIQNTDAASTSVTVTYSPGSAGSACTETQSIGAGASATFGLASSCVGTGVAGAFVGAAAVTTNSANQTLVAIVNQTNFNDQGSAYNAIDPSTATTTLNYPLIMQNNFGYFTGFNVYNPSAGSVSVDCTFSSGSNKPTDFNVNLNSGASHTAVQTEAGQYVGSATCVSTGGNIVGVANELGAAGADTFFAYGGFNQ